METQWSGQKVRDTFVDFYKGKAHSHIVSSPVVPHDDPTLLFANAGMNQFKPIFLGSVDPKSDLAKLKRAVNSQKCIRAGGKHNDLDDVGKDTYHHTFFEMLGTWSFGDYFKEESISWAWELLTKVYGLNPERIYATYFGGNEKEGVPSDEDAKQIWLRFLPASRVLPFQRENFWEMANTGPCGPCSEIHYDRIGGRDAASMVNRDDPTVIEIWNHVFIQFNREDSGKLLSLPAKHIDTGMGLERLTSILQEKLSNYDTDLFTYIFDELKRVCPQAPVYAGKLGKEDPNAIDMAYRVVADHIRTLTFAVNDGAAPGNTGRNYVCKRILRRAVRYGVKKLGAPQGFFCQLVNTVVNKMAPAFPELKRNPDAIIQILKKEEEAFLRTLDKGTVKFNNIAEKCKDKKVSGEQAFKLYDTFGFPVDLTQLMAEERGLVVDRTEFDRLLRIQQQQSSDAADKVVSVVKLDVNRNDTLSKKGVHKTDDSGKYNYNEHGHVTAVQAHIRAIFDGKEFVETFAKDAHVGLVLDKTNFYAESGGQTFDAGTIENSHGKFSVEQVQSGNFVLHVGTCHSGEFKVGDVVTCHVDAHRRLPVMSNHTATHLINWALRKELAKADVEQRGSLVLPEKFRFDFSFDQSLTLEQLQHLDAFVNELIKKNLTVYAKEATLEHARTIKGLRAVFGEAYPDPVRVVSIGRSVEEDLKHPDDPTLMDYSIEFCGGTHVPHSGVIQHFVITEQMGLGAGVRRVVAVTGNHAKKVLGNADKFRVQLHAVLEKFKAASDPAAAEKLEPELIDTVAKLIQQLEAQDIPLLLPAAARTSFQNDILKMQDQLKTISLDKKKRQQERAKAYAERVSKELTEKPTPFHVGLLEVGGNDDALRTAIQAILAVHPKMAVLLATVDLPAKEKKIQVMAQVNKELIGKIKAGDWVKETAAQANGKGGGKPEGPANAYGTDGSKIDVLIKFASEYAQKKLSA